jgi:hypothetical protein
METSWDAQLHKAAKEGDLYKLQEILDSGRVFVDCVDQVCACFFQVLLVYRVSQKSGFFGTWKFIFLKMNPLGVILCGGIDCAYSWKENPFPSNFFSNFL